MSNHHYHPYSRPSYPGDASPEWFGRIHANAPIPAPANSSQPQRTIRRSHRPPGLPTNDAMAAYSSYPLANSELPRSSRTSFNESSQIYPQFSGGHQLSLQPVHGPLPTACHPQISSNMCDGLDLSQETSVQPPPPRNELSSQRLIPSSRLTPQLSPLRSASILANYSDHGNVTYTASQLRPQGGRQTTQPSPAQPQSYLGDMYSEASYATDAIHYLDKQMRPDALPPTQPSEFDHGQNHDMLPITGAGSNILAQSQVSNLHPSSHGSHQSRHYFQNGEFRAPYSNITFIGGDQTNNNGGDISLRAMEMLKAHCAPSALLNSKERFANPRCAEQTRTAVLRTLIAWVERAGLSTLLGWLRGPAGAGKSTIAQTLAEECKRKGLLAATFFFSRTGSAERADGDRLIPTIILQLILEFPELRPLVMAAITANPIFFDQSRRVQLEELLVKPFHTLGADSNHEGDPNNASSFRLTGNARLIVIDGLDECDDYAVQIDLLKIIGDATRWLPHPFRFLIVSRPEAHISHTFNHKLDLEDGRPLRMDLDNDPDADADIRRYLELEFNRMRNQHPNHQLLPVSWPPIGAVDSLVERASKQFIYPAVALKFIWNNEDFPAQSLQLILDLKLARRCAERPFAPLDELYTFVFSKVLDKHLDTIARLFSLLGYAREYGKKDLDTHNGEASKSPVVFERLLRLSQGQLSIVLKPLLSLLSIPRKPKNNLKIYHASLFDFLKDRNRGIHLKFQLSRGRGWETLALYWLQPGQKEDSAENRRNCFCQALPDADLTNELKLGIMNYDVPINFKSPQLLWAITTDFVRLLRERTVNTTSQIRQNQSSVTYQSLYKDLHYEDFALFRHQSSKIILALEVELIGRKIWPRGETFEIPASPFVRLHLILISRLPTNFWDQDDTLLSIHYRIIDAICRFCSLVGWGPVGQWSNLKWQRDRRLVLTFLGRNREFADYFTLRVIDECAYCLYHPSLFDDKDKVIWGVARQVVRIRLQVLSPPTPVLWGQTDIILRNCQIRMTLKKFSELCVIVKLKALQKSELGCGHSTTTLSAPTFLWPSLKDAFDGITL